MRYTVARTARTLANAVRVVAGLNAVVSRTGAGRRIGRCPGCDCTVFESDPHTRYRGDVYHLEPCVEIARRGRAARRRDRR